MGPNGKSTSVGKLTPAVIGLAIDDVPVNRRLFFLIFICMCGTLFDSFDNALLSYAMPGIRKDFQLNPAQLGLVGASAQWGMAVGAYLWGWIGDRKGRVICLVLTILIFSLFTGFAALAFSAGFIIGVRFIAGTGLGGAIPVDLALMAEYTPARHRGRLLGMAPLGYPLGVFFAAAVGLYVVPTFGWRWVFVVGVVPALLVVALRMGVPESPRWLASRGRSEQARKGLHYIGVDDRQIDIAYEKLKKEPVPEVQPQASISDLFAPALRRRLVHTWILWFCNGIPWVGFVVWMPTIYATVYHINIVRTLAFSLATAGCQVLGRLTAILLLDKVGRRPFILVGFGVPAVLALAFIPITTNQTQLLVTAMFFAYFMDVGNAGYVVYTPEVYPLRLRSLGFGFASALGRIAGGIGPMLIGFLLMRTGVTGVWITFSICLAVGAISTLLIGIETRGKNLEVVSEVKTGEGVPGLVS
jgi:putative MFS transporter